MDLVVGATGLVGKRIALRLREEGRNVRALVRGGTQHAQAKELIGAGVEIADADLTRPETLAAACAGIETVVCTASSMPQGRADGLRRVDREGVLALIEAAERSGAKGFLYASYSGNIRDESPLMVAYTKGDVISESQATAERFGIHLRSVRDYAATFR